MQRIVARWPLFPGMPLDRGQALGAISSGGAAPHPDPERTLQGAQVGKNGEEPETDDGRAGHQAYTQNKHPFRAFEHAAAPLNPRASARART